MIRNIEKCVGDPRPVMYAYKSIEDYNNRKNAIHLLNGGMGTLKSAAKGAFTALKKTLGDNATPVVVVKGNNETYILK